MDWHTPHPMEIAGLMRELAATLLGAQDPGQALEALATTVHQTLSVPCSVALWGVSHPAVIAARPRDLAVLSEIQFQNGDGPGITAIQLRDTVACRDLTTDGRWPAWRREALRHGVRSVLAVPLDVDHDSVATLTMYAPAPHAIDTSLESVARLLAEHAGLLLAHLLRQKPAPVTDGDPLLHRAAGLIMARCGCPEDEARAFLAAASHSLSLPITELAERLVTAAVH
ncbi:GAF and ANTAR domain-containing protein [Catenuloplanes sp. NPDC051500]|uniref:GAF and ANTAR domain-containing protein n=1 Tax=Catenuloplanes sp. NPDC051500 TaxID=3363959 RepID=UPI00379F218D